MIPRNRIGSATVTTMVPATSKPDVPPPEMKTSPLSSAIRPKSSTFNFASCSGCTFNFGPLPEKRQPHRLSYGLKKSPFKKIISPLNYHLLFTIYNHYFSPYFPFFSYIVPAAIFMSFQTVCQKKRILLFDKQISVIFFINLKDNFADVFFLYF